MTYQDYNSYNSRFEDIFIYRLGGSTGFFSEYNNMILAIHYCLVNEYQFVLESENANFSSGQGWNEFFIPFCNEIRNKWLNKFNYRVKPVYKNKYEWFFFNLYKKIHPRYHYMYSLFDDIRLQSLKCQYHINKLNLHGTLLQNCSAIHKMIWSYNPQTKARITDLIKSVGLPNSYAGIHIRQGDKIEEASLYDIDKYLEVLQRNSTEQNVFVLTDDYSVIEYLRSHYTNYIFTTLCQPDENGYSLAKLLETSFDKQREAYFRLWASMDILSEASFFVGTYSANPGMNLGFRMDPSRIKCIDFEEWQLW